MRFTSWSICLALPGQLRADWGHVSLTSSTEIYLQRMKERQAVVHKKSSEIKEMKNEKPADPCKLSKTVPGKNKTLVQGLPGGQWEGE